VKVRKSGVHGECHLNGLKPLPISDYKSVEYIDLVDDDFSGDYNWESIDLRVWKRLHIN
jgi:hypothetical protein